MKNLLNSGIALVAVVVLGAAQSPAQSMDDLNLQVHGYATQGLVYTTNNNWDTTNSTDGSAAWTEAVVNLTMQPQLKMRIGMQARYYILGSYGDQIILDWAELDLKVNEHFGFRVGDVKTPTSLLNEIQDIDPAYPWILLPQSMYPLASRDSILDHYGAVAYGAIPLGEHVGKLQYRGFGGDRKIGGDDGYFQPFRDVGLTLPNGIQGSVYGATLRWQTPIDALLFGVSYDIEHPSGQVDAGTMQGTMQSSRLKIPVFFGKYEVRKLMFAGEYARVPVKATFQFPGVPAIIIPLDQRSFYVMASYKITPKLSGGIYYSSANNRQGAFTSTGSRYQKDWALNARYDFNAFLYAKAEQHFADGTYTGFSASDNSSLQPNTRMTMLKLGVTF
jgi:hypothetical protein